MRREIRLVAGEGRYSVLSDRAVIAPWGLGGARAGAPVRVSVLRDGAEIEFPTPGKVTGHPLVEGDVVVMQSAGGGGFGDPLDREPERVRADVAAGYVSRERARDGYGVILTSAGEIDLAETRALRSRLRASRRRFPVRADERDPYEGVRGKHRVLRVNPDLARELGLESGDLVELLGRHPAPLRAWVKLDAEARAAEIPLDSLARRILGVGADGDVEVRRVQVEPCPSTRA
jgi:N-methylhydantoinase B